MLKAGKLSLSLSFGSPLSGKAYEKQLPYYSTIANQLKWLDPSLTLAEERDDWMNQFLAGWLADTLVVGLTDRLRNLLLVAVLDSWCQAK